LVTAKGIAQLGAVIGRQFSYELLQVLAHIDEPTLQRELGRLVEAELLYQRGVPPQATYLFKHALIRDAAYESLLKSSRQQYHQRIAQTLAAQLPETAERQPELLAYHYTEAGLNAQALGYWYKAGQRANERSAFVEAIAHLTTGLEVLAALPNPSNSAPPPVSLVYGRARGSERKRGSYWSLCIRGLRRGLIPLTLLMRRRCWTNYPDGKGCGSFETTGARVAHSHPNSHCVTRNFVETLTFLKV
jgi:hypothetical protein